MVVLMKLLGIVCIGAAVVFLIKPKALNQYIQYWLKGKRVIFGGIVSFIFGIIFLLAAKHCQWIGFFVLFGIITLFKGAMLVILGEKRMAQVSKEIMEISSKGKRILSLFVLGIGVLMIIAA